MPTLQTDGAELYYERTGVGGRERVVLTHGAWTDARTWLALAERLADRYEVVMWDRRGHSRSRDGTTPGSAREDATDLAAILEHLGGESAHAVGNSAGGNVVLNLVTMRPGLVRTAAVHEPGPFGLLERSGDPHLVQAMERDKELTGRVEDMIARGEEREAAQHFMEYAIGPGSWDTFDDQLRDTFTSNASTVPDDLRDAWDPDSVDVDALAGSPIPLLISTGTDSPELERAAAHELARRLPRARLAALTGTGHIPHRTDTVDYADLLTRFFEGAFVEGVSP